MKKISLIIAASLLGAGCFAQEYKSQRPAEGDRLFVSEAVENKIEEVCGMLTNPRLRWMFSNCYPNTIDTTVHFGEDENGNPRTFVYTGDIHAMWLRDSGAQVWPYLTLASKDENLRKMLEGVVRCQLSLVSIDPYANAFNDGPTGGPWMSDGTDMNPNDHERKWEVDSPCYVIRLAYGYWKATGDDSVFDAKWLEAMHKIYDTFVVQQRKNGQGPYSFLRVTDRQLDTKNCVGLGNPVKPVGLIASAFRPSDDATTFEFLVPSNFFAVSSLRKAAEILDTVNGEKAFAQQCLALADEVEKALKEYAVYKHPKYGKIYAFEVDGFGNQYIMDDANVPSLLALSYLDPEMAKDKIYKNTRKFVWSLDNPYFFKGTAAEGIGGPHIGYDMVWPMSILMKAFTSNDDEEIRWCIETLMKTDAGTGFMHESFNKDNPENFTREWFAWQNTLFGELILTLIEKGKLDLLNSITIE
ncbi:MAG: glycoside hydrolase family 125 protein [Bacteroidales bacterium]|nr:glycoside hydrolase family 125 protein [Bacteroidales bacterium]